MSNNFFEHDEPTEPVRRAQPPQSPTVYGQGGQPAWGSFSEAQSRQDRGPYQYPPPAQPVPPQVGQQHKRLGFPGQGQRVPSQNPYGDQRQQGQQWQQGRPVSPIVATPSAQPKRGANGAGSPRAGVKPPQKRRRRWRTGCLVTSLIVLVLLVVVGAFAVTTGQRVLAFGKVISTQDPLSTQEGYMNTSNRVNVLIMGYGGGSHDGAYLTDSLVVMSLLPASHHTTLVSVPRDLWVQVPEGSGNYQKINAVYEVGSNNNAKPVNGGDAAAQKVSLVTGLDVKYWVTINFNGFRELINSIGGVDVYVPDSFNACYPKNDNANVDASWIKVQFNKGMQHMDGETAIRYARAREPLEVCGMGTSENLAELTDFGRSARQQIIMKAVLTRVKQVSAWPSMFDAMTALQHTIFTNMSLADLAQFALKMDLNDAHRVGLSNQNVLVDSQASDGGYILQPGSGGWPGIVAYVKQQLYN